MVPARPGVTKERVWLAELGRYLGCDRAALRRFAKRQGLLKRASGHAVTRVYYVTPYGAQRLIAYIRAIQGDAYLHGKQPLEDMVRRSEREAAARLRKHLDIAAVRPSP